jgi:hypothetical protein
MHTALVMPIRELVGPVGAVGRLPDSTELCPPRGGARAGRLHAAR